MSTGCPEPVTRIIKRRKRSKQSDNLEKICAVCRAPAKGMHFGGMACNSCKAFFRRNIQSESYKSFKCSRQMTCPVIKDKRKICQYCRYEKCLGIGMEVKWVMSEEERLCMWKSQLWKKKRVMSGDSTSVSKPTPLTKVVVSKEGLPYDKSSRTQSVIAPSTVLNPDKQAIIDRLIAIQELVFSSNRYPEECYSDTPAALGYLFFCVCLKIHKFFSQLDDFHLIPIDDRPVKLRNGISMSIYLHGAYTYDVKYQRWGAEDTQEALKGPNVSLETVREFTKDPETFSTMMKFFNSYGNDLKDEVVLVLLSLITLFHDSDEGFKATTFPGGMDSWVFSILKHYLIGKRGKVNGNRHLNRLLNGLTIVNSITRYHKLIDLQHSIDADQLISKSLVSPKSHKKQMVAVNELLSQVLIADIPKYSSAFSPEEKVDLKMSRMHLELPFPHHQNPPDLNFNFSLHHPITNALLGEEIRTDMLLSYTQKSIYSLNANSMKSNTFSASGASSISANIDVAQCNNSSECYIIDNSEYKDGNSKSTRKGKCKDSVKLNNVKKKKIEKHNQRVSKRRPSETCHENTESTLFETDPIKFSQPLSKPFGFPFS